MRIALLTDGLFPDVIGGMQKHSFFLARYLARSKVHVDLYYTASSPEKRKAFQNFTEAESKYIHEVFVPFPNRGSLPGHYLKESFDYSKLIYREWKQRPPVDFIYAQGLTGWYFCEQKKKGTLQPIFAVNLHGVEMFQKTFGWKARFQQAMLKGPARFIMNHADMVYSLGGKLTEIIRGELKDPSCVVEQSIGIDRNWISPQPVSEKPGDAPRKFIFVGRYEKRKGLDVLNKAMAASSTKCTEFHLVGPIDKRHQIEASNVIYHGLISDEHELQRLLDQCEVLVCPSFAEGMPTVILEAMARGLAVIASDVGAVNELVSNKTGWLVKAGNLQQLVSAINEASTSSIENKRLESLRLVSDKFTWDKVVADTLQKIESRLIAH